MKPKSKSKPHGALGANETVKKTAQKKVRSPKKSVLFVCTGNTCRSAMAEAILKKELSKKKLSAAYSVASAGLSAEDGAPMTDNAIAALAQMGITVKNHRAKQLTSAMVQKSDLIVCMTLSHKQALSAYTKNAFTVAELTGGNDVLDPYGMSLAVYSQTAQYLQYACTDVLTWFDAKNNKNINS